MAKKKKKVKKVAKPEKVAKQVKVDVASEAREKEINGAISKLATEIYETNLRIDRIVAAIDKSKSVRGL